jgi:CBS domain-containing protein
MMRVADIMTSEPVTVRADASVRDIAQRLVDHGVSGLPVVDEHGRLIGIVTEADLIPREAYPGRRRALGLLSDLWHGRRYQWAKKTAGSVAADVMTTPAVAYRPDEDVRVAARRMLERGVKRLPVVEHRRPVGIISRRDVLGTMNRADEAVQADVARLLSGSNRPDLSHVNCSAEGGVVHLEGDVRHGWDQQVVVAMVRGVDGVVDVISDLHAREPDPRPAPRPWSPLAR